MWKLRWGRDANSRWQLRYFYRDIKKHTSFPLVLVRAPRKEALVRPSSWSRNFVDSLEPSPHASGSPMCLPTSLTRTTPRRLHCQASNRNVAGLFPSGTRWQQHHKRCWCSLARLQAPPSTNTMHAKHLWSRGMQTSLATKPSLEQAHMSMV
jgi:hypothetical protein